MNETSNIVALRQPDDIDDPWTNILRAGARQLLAQDVHIEVKTFLPLNAWFYFRGPLQRPLRRRHMIEDMTICKLAPKTQQNYIHHQVPQRED